MKMGTILKYCEVARSEGGQASTWFLLLPGMKAGDEDVPRCRAERSQDLVSPEAPYQAV